MRLYLLGCEKTMTSRSHLILLPLFMMFPVIIFQSRITDTEEDTNSCRHTDGSGMSKEETQEEVHHEKLKWTGTTNVAWWSRLKVAKKAIDKCVGTHFFNMEKMNVPYGKDWYENYQGNERDYVCADDTKEAKKGRRILYLHEGPLPSYKGGIADEATSMPCLSYGETMLADRPWNSEDDIFEAMYSSFGNEKVVAPTYSLDVSRAELQLLKDCMSEKESFRYGNSREWFSSLETCFTVGIVLMVWVLVVSSNVVSRERKWNMLGVLSSCSRGDNALFLPKLATMIICALIGLLLMILPVTLYTWLSGNFGGMAVNITEGLYMVSVFTCQEGFFIPAEVLVLGAVICIILGTFASTCLKSSYISLGPRMLCTLIGAALFSYASWVKLFPFKLMKLTCVAARGLTYNLFDQAFPLWRLLPLAWILCSFPLCYATLCIYRSYSYYGIQRL